MEAISVIKMMPETALQINDFANRCISSVENGHENALDIYLIVTAAIKSLEQIKDSIKPIAYEEAEKYGTKFERNSAVVNLRQTSKYFYDKTGDLEYEAIVNNFNRFKKDKSDKEKQLKTLTKPMDVIDQETGEVYTIYPPAKSSTDTLVISFPEPEAKDFDPKPEKKDLPF